MSLADLLARWPLLTQIRTRSGGTSTDAMSARTRELLARTDVAQDEGVKVARSVCPYCGVGCGQRVWHKDGKLLAIDGDPESPINQGTLCPKGSASHELLTHAGRLTKVMYRKARGTAWETLELDRAMDMVAARLWESRKRTWVESENGKRVAHTSAVAHLGGATLDNEENYLIKKLFTGGLGMVSISNQARI
jgi:formate dehydrogenase major subunit